MKLKIGLAYGRLLSQKKTCKPVVKISILKIAIPIAKKLQSTVLLVK